MEWTFCLFHSFLTIALQVAASVSCKSLLQHPVRVGAHQRRAIVWAQCFSCLLCKFCGAATVHPPTCHTSIWSHSIDIASLSHCSRKYRYKNGNHWDIPDLKTYFLCVKWLLLNSKSIGLALLLLIKISPPFPEICSDLTKYMVFWVTAYINKHKG